MWLQPLQFYHWRKFAVIPQFCRPLLDCLENLFSELHVFLTCAWWRCLVSNILVCWRCVWDREIEIFFCKYRFIRHLGAIVLSQWPAVKMHKFAFVYTLYTTVSLSRNSWEGLEDLEFRWPFKYGAPNQWSLNARLDGPRVCGTLSCPFVEVAGSHLITTGVLCSVLDTGTWWTSARVSIWVVLVLVVGV